MNVEDKTEFIMAIRNYTYKKTETNADYIDVTASDSLNKKILFRSLEPHGKAGFVGVDDVKNMIDVIENESYDRGIFIGKRFTEAAVQEMADKKIQLISDEYMPHFDTEKLYLTITNCINNQCKTNCGKIPEKKSECKQVIHGASCKVRALSDNSTFHFQHGWVDMMQNDLKQLLAIRKALK